MLCALVILLVPLGAVYGQLLYTQRCPTVPPLAGFDMKKYEGVWYEQSRTFSAFQNIGQCWTRNYTAAVGNANEYLVKTSFSTLLSPSSVDYRIFKKANSDSWSVVDYFVSAVPLIRGSYQIVETDYQNWSVEWECTDALGVHTEITRILGRVPTLAPQYYEEARTAAGRHNLDIRQLQIVSNGGCLTIPQLIRDVVLRIAGGTTSTTPSSTSVSVQGTEGASSTSSGSASPVSAQASGSPSQDEISSSGSQDNAPETSSTSRDKTPDTSSTSRDKTPDTSSTSRDKTPDTISTSRDKTPDTSSALQDKTPDTSSASQDKTPDTSNASQDKASVSNSDSEMTADVPKATTSNLNKGNIGVEVVGSSDAISDDDIDDNEIEVY